MNGAESHAAVGRDERLPDVTALASSAARAVEDRLFAALAVLRVIVLINAVGLNIYRHANFQHPWAGAACVVVMIAWTGIAYLAYRQPDHRTVQLLVFDLALAVSLMLATPLIKGEGFRATIPGTWVAAALLAWAIRFHWRGGMAAGLILAVADLVPRQELRQSDYNNAFLLVLAGAIVGYLCGSLQTMATERDVAERGAAVAAERARLARAVHDGVLQVLALVQRRGREMGGDSAALGELAGEQERKLRRLIQAQDTLASRPGVVDVAASLTHFEDHARVTVSTPGHPIELPSHAAEEVVAVVAACLDNVRLHVGEQAQAWVLLQAHPDRIEVSVRDDGEGITEGRIEQAARQGRLGISESIRGRIASLGGTSELVTGRFGTEWEFVIPREHFEGS